MPTVEFVVDASSAPLDEIDRVVMAAYGCPSRKARIERLLRVGGAWALLREEGRLLATGALIAYPSGGFGWLALVATEPAAERRGFGRIITETLVDDLRARSCGTALDASAKGAPLYQQMGFGEFGLTRVYSRQRCLDPQPLPGVEYTAIDERDWPELIRYDLHAFGADRSVLLRDIVAHAPGRNVVLRMHQKIVGYGIAQDDVLGPIVADNHELGASIVDTLGALPWSQSPTLIVPPESSFAPRAESLGFVEQRSLRRQHLGIAALPGQRQLLCAQTSLGEG